MNTSAPKTYETRAEWARAVRDGLEAGHRYVTSWCESGRSIEAIQRDGAFVVTDQKRTYVGGAIIGRSWQDVGEPQSLTFDDPLAAAAYFLALRAPGGLVMSFGKGPPPVDAVTP